MEIIVYFIAFVSLLNLIFTIAIAKALTKMFSPRKEEMFITRTRKNFNAEDVVGLESNFIRTDNRKNWNGMPQENENE